MISALLLAVAGPVYLQCELGKEEPFPVEITADEANGTAIINLVSTGRIVRRTAIFSSGMVTIPDEPTVWVIDRVDLKIRRKMNFMPASDPGQTGTCKVVEPPEKRAF